MATTPKEIKKGILNGSLSISSLEKILGEMSFERKLEVIDLWGKSVQRQLYNNCEGRQVVMEDIVPSLSDGREVIHYGRNTLPLFTHFQKRFITRAEWHGRGGTSLESAEVIGYNHLHSVIMSFITPGYFYAYEDRERGEFVIDYHEVPEEGVVGWPSVMANESRLGRFVYAKMIDRLRKVAPGVTIGRAYKGGEAMDAWFTLLREG